MCKTKQNQDIQFDVKYNIFVKKKSYLQIFALFTKYDTIKMYIFLENK